MSRERNSNAAGLQGNRCNSSEPKQGSAANLERGNLPGRFRNQPAFACGLYFLGRIELDGGLCSDFAGHRLAGA